VRRSGPADALVVFGATGDLAHKQIWPALYGLAERGALTVPVFGVAGSPRSDDQLREIARAAITANGGNPRRRAWTRVEKTLRYLGGDYRERDAFEALRDALRPYDAPMYYLAIPPSLFETVVRSLQRTDGTEGARIVVEKPFGHDLASAKRLNGLLERIFGERDIYRIDHFLGKESVESLLYFRFANAFAEPLLRHEHVASVQVTMAEDFGVADRGRFYDETGAVRDVIQNHLLQVTAIVAMEPPTRHADDSLRDAKATTVKAMRPLNPSDTVLGQYRGYRQVPGVSPRSTTETYAALRLYIDTWRWAGVPFFIRAGKCLPVRVTEVLVQLRHAPDVLTGERHRGGVNHLRFRIDPKLEIALGARTKAPGETFGGRDVELDVPCQSGSVLAPYDRLLGEALVGDQSSFARWDSVEASWRVVDPILGDKVPVKTYDPGSWGPSGSDALIRGAGRWVAPRAG
jgi:glucose-6-phosphate 1-dehydrogenase